MSNIYQTLYVPWEPRPEPIRVLIFSHIQSAPSWRQEMTKIWHASHFNGLLPGTTKCVQLQCTLFCLHQTRNISQGCLNTFVQQYSLMVIAPPLGDRKWHDLFYNMGLLKPWEVLIKCWHHHYGGICHGQEVVVTSLYVIRSGWNFKCVLRMPLWGDWHANYSPRTLRPLLGTESKPVITTVVSF